MKQIKLFLLILFIGTAHLLFAGNHIFSIKGTKTFLNEKEILVVGLRCSNALYSEKSTAELIENLDVYKSYGLNTVSVFIMGSRYGNFKGYLEDASLNPVFSERLAKIIKAADKRGMIVLVGCLYWGGSTAKWESWTQEEANLAIENTIKFLMKNNFRNVFVDMDNEGMAMREKGFDPGELVRAAKKVDSSFVIATNFHGIPPAEADMGIHFSEKDPQKPYIESEGTPTNAPGNYWGKYSKAPPLGNYINIGIYTEEMKVNQLEITKRHFENGWGYMLASTWLQCVAPHGPNANPGGDGSLNNPGILWWLQAVKEMKMNCFKF